MTFVDQTQQQPFVDTSPSISQIPQDGGLSQEDPAIQKQQAMQQLAAAHPWMPADAASALATSGLPADVVDTSAEGLRKVAQAANQGISHIWQDPVLQKQPSTALALQRWLGQAIGPAPISETDLVKTQTNLVKQGFGSGLEVNGVWNPAWQSAWRQYSQAVITDQLGGNQTGSKPIGGVLHALTAVMPKEAANALIGFVKSIPHDVRQLMADTVMAVGTPVSVVAGSRATDTAAGFVMGQTPEQYIKAAFGDKAEFKGKGVAGGSWGHVLSRAVEDTGTVMLFDALARAGGSIVGAAAHDAVNPEVGGSIVKRVGEGFGTKGAEREAAIKALGLDEAYRGPGVIANSVGRVADLGNAKWMENIPVLNRVGPWVGSLNDADGLYYRARTLLATPYVYTPVRVAGTAVQTLGVAGAEARGIAALAQKGDPNNPLSADVEGTRTLDAVDDAMRNRLSFTVLGKRLSPAIDDLGFIMHAPEGVSSGIVGGQARDIVSAIDHALGPDTGIGAQIERGTGMTMSKLQQAANGDEEGWQRFWNDKVNQHAASHYAQRKMSLMGIGGQELPDYGTPEFIRLARSLEHEAWTDPAVMSQAKQEMLANPGELASRIRKEIVDTAVSKGDPLAYQSEGLKTYLPASKIMREVIAPNKQLLLGDMAEANPDLQLGLAKLDTPTSLEAKAAGRGFGARLEDINNRAAAAAENQKRANSIDVMTGNGTEAPPPGHVRLYRGEAEGAGGVSADSELHLQGRFFTSSRMDAGSYAKRASLASGTPERVSYVDVHADDAKRFLHNGTSTEYLLPDEHLQRVRAEGEAPPGSPSPRGVEPVDPANRPKSYDDLVAAKSHLATIDSKIATEERFVREFSDPKTRETFGVDAADQRLAQARKNLDHWQSQRSTAAAAVEDAKKAVKTVRAPVRTEFPDIAEYQLLDRDVSNYLADHFGIDGRRMPHDIESKLQVLQDRAELLAGPVKYKELGDFPAPVSKALADLKDLGYKPVVANDIGFRFEDQPLFDVTKDATTFRRRAISAIGLNPTRIPTSTIGSFRYNAIRSELQDLVDSGKVTLPPYYTVDTVLHDLRDQNILSIEAPRLKAAIGHLFRRDEDRMLNEAVAAMKGLPKYSDLSDVELRRLAQSTQESELGNAYQLRDLPRQKVVNALTRDLTDSDRFPEVEQGISRLNRNKAAAPGAWNHGDLGHIAEPMDIGMVRGFMAPDAPYDIPDGLGKSLMHDGFNEPITVRYNPKTREAMVEDGHARLNAAQAAGMPNVPVVFKIDRTLTDGVPVDGALPMVNRMKDGKVFSPTRIFGGTGQPNDLLDVPTQLFSERDADRIYRAVVRGSAKVPIGMVGIAKLEDLFRSSLGFAGEALPGSFGEKIANLPNALVKIRNDLRFDMSPEFSVRRVLKSNVKMAMEGITGVMNPTEAMIKAGTLEEDRALLNRLLPNQFSKQNEEIEHLLRNNDLFNLYNHQDAEAYAAGQYVRMGHSEEEAKAMIVRAFNYGSYQTGMEGRSAAERSMNFMFFPFSFDKTVYRNLGGYLLDHPAQMFMASAGLAAYHDFSQAHPDSPIGKKWLNAHVPVLEELLRLNPLAHGIGLGEPGGINAPLLNFFLPQVISAANPDAAKTLKRVIPAYKSFGRVYKEMVEQGHIIGTSVGNLIDDKVKGMKASPFLNIRHPAETLDAQAVDGQKFYNTLLESFSPYVEWNAKHSSKPDQQVKFPMAERFGGYAGKVINTEILKDMVHRRFPGYDPNLALELGAKDNQALLDYQLTVPPNSPQAAKVDALITIAKKYKSAIASGRYDKDPQSAARATMAIRNVASQVAMQDANFLRVWDKAFGGAFGPLEGVTNGN